MFSIGEFASIGRVSVRMLRHYDEIGLLPPAHVDPSTGYRSYEGAQFATLAQLLGYKDLGFRLDEVTRIVQGDISNEALHRMLRSRRAQLAREVDLDLARLRRLDTRLRSIEGEQPMSTLTTELKSLDTLRFANARAIAPGFGPENISPIIGPLFGNVIDALTAAGVAPSGAALATYEAVDEPSGGAAVFAGFIVADDVTAAPGFEVVDLPRVELAATTVHHGSMATIGDSWEALLTWIEENGYQLAGICRELYIVSEPEPQENWVTELQQPVVRA